ncbi:hypothetical protein BaRGS_00002453, partial [Batillaria attramentaria]
DELISVRAGYVVTGTVFWDRQCSQPGRKEKRVETDISRDFKDGATANNGFKLRSRVLDQLK